MNLIGTIRRTIGQEWLQLPGVRVGRIPSGQGTPDLYVTLTDGNSPLFRIDVYKEGPQSPFEAAIVWQRLVTVGAGNRAYIVDIHDYRVTEIELESYFCGFFETAWYLLIASATALLRLDPGGVVGWRAGDLGIDGVVVETADDHQIVARGEWDPPGGWRRVVVDAATGRLTSGCSRRSLDLSQRDRG